jgi:hypothetical protein
MSGYFHSGEGSPVSALFVTVGIVAFCMQCKLGLRFKMKIMYFSPQEGGIVKVENQHFLQGMT